MPVGDWNWGSGDLSQGVLSISILLLHTDLGTQSRISVCLYRSHKGDTEETRLFKYLSKAIDNAQERFPTADWVILGDFNAQYEQWLVLP